MHSAEMLKMIQKHIEDGNYTVDSVEFGKIKGSESLVTHESLDGPIAEEATTDEYQEIKITVKRSYFEAKNKAKAE